MGVAGEVDQPPDLGPVQHREECRGVLEAGRDRAPARDAFLTVRLRFDEREDGLVGGRVEGQLAHGQHRRRALDLGLLLDERDRTDEDSGQLVSARPPEVGREHPRDAASAATSLADADTQHFRVRQQAVEVGVPRPRGVDGAAVERSDGGVPEGELGPECEIGEVDQEVCALGGREHEALLRDRHGRAEQPALAPDLGDPPVIGLRRRG